MRSGQYIDYEALAQEAMRGIVRAVLSQVKKSGLFGEHHFYIAFDTQAPGVSLSKRLREKYPQEMTIVLQHRFWDLDLDESGFEVKLTFDGIPERLAVPYKAVKVFYDPSVPYGLQFEGSELAADGSRRGDAMGGVTQLSGTSAEKPTMLRPENTATERRPKRTRPEKIDKGRSEPKTESPLRVAPALSPAASGANATDETDNRPAGRTTKPQPVLIDVTTDDTPTPEGSGKVVDLSKFRKK